MRGMEYKLALLRSLNLFTGIFPQHVNGVFHCFYAEDKSTLKPEQLIVIDLEDLTQKDQTKIIRFYEYLYQKQTDNQYFARLKRIMFKEKFLILGFQLIDGVSIYHLIQRDQGIFPAYMFGTILKQLTELYDECHNRGMYLSEASLRMIKWNHERGLVLQVWGLGFVANIVKEYISDEDGKNFGITFLHGLKNDELRENLFVTYIMLYLFEGPYLAQQIFDRKNLLDLPDFSNLRNATSPIKEWFALVWMDLERFLKGAQFRKKWRKLNKKKISTAHKMALAAVFLLGLIAWGFVDYYSQFGKIFIEGLPAGAVFYVNHNEKEVENGTWIRLKAGTYEIRCEAEGYSSFCDTIQIEKSGKDSLKISMHPGAYMTMDIYPENTMVQIDSLPAETAERVHGKTFFLLAGMHAIRLSFSPYISITDSISLQKFEKYHYQKDLSKYTGILQVVPPEKDGQVFVIMDLKNLDITEADAGYESHLTQIELPKEKWENHPLRIGRHRLVYKHPKYDDIVREFTIIAGQTTKVELSLPKNLESNKLKQLQQNFLGKENDSNSSLAGTLIINTGYKWHYLKGLGEKFENKRKFISKVENIPAGKYTITLSNPHFEDFDLKIEIKENQTDSLVIDLAGKKMKHFVKTNKSTLFREIAQ